MAKEPKQTDKRRPVVENLEPRLLFSAGLEAVLLSDHAGADEDAARPAIELDVTDSAVAARSSSPSAEARATRHELVFVDAGTPDYQQLVDDVRAGSTDERILDVIVLDADRDGVAQITEILAGQEGLDAVHVVSHGSDGNVTLGNTHLGADNLDDYRAALAAWDSAFDAQADLLFYGCDLAAGGAGEAFVAAVSALTGTDVAASTSTLR